MELISEGVQWYYLSYDHKAAVDELMQAGTSVHFSGSAPTKPDYSYFPVPNEVKNNHLVWRVGKLRSMRFDPDGMINRMYIGRMYKYAKVFSPRDMGKTVKPILNWNCDRWGLISAGLAIDETNLN